MAWDKIWKPRSLEQRPRGSSEKIPGFTGDSDPMGDRYGSAEEFLRSDWTTRLIRQHPQKIRCFMRWFQQLKTSRSDRFSWRGKTKCYKVGPNANQLQISAREWRVELHGVAEYEIPKGNCGRWQCGEEKHSDSKKTVKKCMANAQLGDFGMIQVVITLFGGFQADG